VELLVVDMASFASVSAFASSFTEKHDRLDVLVLNAGVLQYHYEATVDGLETKFESSISTLKTMCSF
jgi:retinol dehydrogenase-14